MNHAVSIISLKAVDTGEPVITLVIANNIIEAGSRESIILGGAGKNYLPVLSQTVISEKECPYRCEFFYHRVCS